MCRKSQPISDALKYIKRKRKREVNGAAAPDNITQE
jgi:hypothetical protein